VVVVLVGGDADRPRLAGAPQELCALEDDHPRPELIGLSAVGVNGRLHFV